MTAFCPHCGKPDAPTRIDEGVEILERHRRLDWVINVNAGNEICAGERTPVGGQCCYGTALPMCWTANQKGNASDAQR